MTTTFEYKLITQHCDENQRVRRVTWQLVASYNGQTCVSEFTHAGPGNIQGELTDEQLLDWIIHQIHPSDLNAMRSGLAANVTSIK